MIDVKTIHSSAVAVEEEVSIELPREECDALRKALRIIGKYRKLALQCVSHKDKHSDWTMVNYSVKNDKAIINVKYGSCG